MKSTGEAYGAQLIGRAAAGTGGHQAFPIQRTTAAEVLSLPAPTMLTERSARRTQLIAQRRARRRKCAADLAVVEPAPQPVGANQQDVVGLERLAQAQRHLGQERLAAQAALDEIAHRMGQRLVGGDHAFAQQELDVAVVARALEDLAAAQKIDAAVADVRPERAAVLHQAHGAGGARPQLERQVGAELGHFLVRTAERQMQESERIENGLRRVPERFDQRLDGGLGGFARHRNDRPCRR